MEPEDKCTSSKDPGLRARYSNLSEFEMPPFCMFSFISGKVALYYMEVFLVVKLKYGKWIYVDNGQLKIWTLDFVLELVPQNGFLCKCFIRRMFSGEIFMENKIGKGEKLNKDEICLNLIL